MQYLRCLGLQVYPLQELHASLADNRLPGVRGTPEVILEV